MEYLGDITTLLDLASRDAEDNDLFPLDTSTTWFTRNNQRRTIPFVPSIQDFPFRGPASYGQRFTFDIGSLPCGDILLGTLVHVQLNHWLDLTTLLQIESGSTTYTDPSTAYFFANSLGSALIEKAELEVDGVTLESIDGDFINVYSSLFANINKQFGVANDSLGYVSLADLQAWNTKHNYPVEDGHIFCILPFFYMRTLLRESLPMVAIKEGSAKIHIKFRPFSEVIRQLRGYRDSCASVPLDTTLALSSGNVKVQQAVPDFAQVKLITQGAYLDGGERQKMMRNPFEHIIRQLQTFYFDTPLKYITSKGANDTITIQLPLEANHPLEEIIWFVRRKDVANNNEWTNYSSVLAKDYHPTFNPLKPLLKNATLQVNGQTLCSANESYYRQLISSYHKGGIVSYNKYIYGYPFAHHPGKHQPSGSLNASRVQSIRLTLEIVAPVGVAWEVKVYCIGLNWIRFENGLCNALFDD